MSVRAALLALLVAALAATGAGCGGGGEQEQQPDAGGAGAGDAQEQAESPPQPPPSAFEAVVNDLPLREPPLPVEQYVANEGGRQLVARLAPKAFFCGRDAAARKAAVSDLYELTRRRFRARGVSGIELVVAPLTASVQDIRPLARGRGGSVALTKRGRGRGPCGR